MMISEQTPFPARGWSLGSGQDPTVTVAASASAAGVCRPAAGTPDPGYGPVRGDPGPGRGLLWFWPQRQGHGACRSGRFRALQAIDQRTKLGFAFSPASRLVLTLLAATRGLTASRQHRASRPSSLRAPSASPWDPTTGLGATGRNKTRVSDVRHVRCIFY